MGVVLSREGQWSWKLKVKGGKGGQIGFGRGSLRRKAGWLLCAGKIRFADQSGLLALF